MFLEHRKRDKENCQKYFDLQSSKTTDESSIQLIMTEINDALFVVFH